MDKVRKLLINRRISETSSSSVEKSARASATQKTSLFQKFSRIRLGAGGGASAGLLMISLSCTTAMATTYYVSPSGANTNIGTSLSAPLLTLQAAANVTNPGDTVYVLNGTYTTPTNRWNNAVLTVNRSGAAGQPITFSAYPGQHPIISTSQNPDVLYGVQIFAAYIVFSGFEVVGNAQYVTLAQATTTYKAEEQAYLASVAANKANPSVRIAYPGDVYTNGVCVAVSSTSHVTLADNLVHDCSASGLDIESSDYTTIENNIVFNTSWWTVYGTSGINFHRSANTDNTTGYRNYVINNISHDNGNTQPFYAYGAGGIPTDGNGIIFDNTQFSSNGQTYAGRTLVMGNISYNNGGAGIEAYYAEHVDIFNNTVVLNNRCPVAYSSCGNLNEGQILANIATDINIYNNVLVSPQGKFTYNAWDSVDLSEGHNLMTQDTGGVVLKPWIVLNPSDLVQSPRFLNLGEIVKSSSSPAADLANVTNPAIAAQALMLVNTSLARNSGASVLDSGTAMPLTPQAMNGNLDTAIDIGAMSFPISSK